MFEFMDSDSCEVSIKVIGIGGGGCNALEHMPRESLEGVEFIAIDADPLDLGKASADIRLHICSDITTPDCESLRAMLTGADMVFIIACMGGRTGTAIAPMVADIAQEMGILTVAVVTTPFNVESKQCMSVALQGIEALSRHANSLITIPNDKLQHRDILPQDASKAASSMLHDAVHGIAELITRPGLINVDVQDVRLVMGEKGRGMVGTGSASGDRRAEEAVEKAISNLLLREMSLASVRGILVNVTAGLDMTIEDFEIVGNVIKTLAPVDATVVVGSVIDPVMQGELHVTLLVTGIGAECHSYIALAENAQ